MTRRAWAIEIAAGLVLALALARVGYTGVGEGGVLGVGLVLWMRWRASRCEPDAGWLRHVAGALSIPVAFVAYAGIVEVDRRFTSTLWLYVPGALVASMLATRPLVGLAAASAWPIVAWTALQTIPLLGLVGLVAMVAVIVHIARTREVRLPLTWLAAGIVLTLACTAVAYEHHFVGDLHPRLHWNALPQHTPARMLLEGTMMVTALATLRGRTWGLLAMIAAAGAYGALAPTLTPAFYYGMHCMPIIVHPLDAGLGRPLATDLVLPLVLLWAVPVGSWLRGGPATGVTARAIHAIPRALAALASWIRWHAPSW